MPDLGFDAAGVADMFSAKIEDVRKCRRYPTLDAVEFFGYQSKVSGKAYLRDISERGARLRLENTRDVPDTFWFWSPFHSLSISCHVRWRSRYEVGVSFDQPLAMLPKACGRTDAERVLPKCLSEFSPSVTRDGPARLAA